MRSSRAAYAAVLAAGLLAACSTSERGDVPDGAPVAPASPGQGADTLTIGVKFDQPGIGHRRDGELEGLDVDVAGYLAEQLGYSPDQIVWEEAISAHRETMLRNGQVDMVVASYSITDARRQDVDFAGPYLVTRQDLLVREDAEEITGPDSLDERVLCSAEGSTSAERVREEHAQGVELYPAATYSECVDLLIEGVVDAVLTDDAILAGYATQPEHEGALRVVGEPFSEERYGVGLPQGSDLCEPLTAAIAEMVEDGTWAEIVTANLGEAYTPDPALNPPEPDPCP